MEDRQVGGTVAWYRSALPLRAASATIRNTRASLPRLEYARSAAPGCRAKVSLIAAFSLGLCGVASARVTGRFPTLLPNATITSDDSGNTDPAPEVSALPPPSAATPAPHHPHPRHHRSAVTTTSTAEVEPTHAIAKLKKDAWAYGGPATSSNTLERVHAGKFINVTGSTRYYVQVKLKQGRVGYVPISAVDMTRPEDKVMRLSSNAAVLSEPNRYGKKLSEVHQGHDVHVVGVSLNYMKIRMKSGLEGYIPMSAAE